MIDTVVVAVAAVGFSTTSLLDCSSSDDVVEHITADCDLTVVQCCHDALNRHVVVCAEFSDIHRECQQGRGSTTEESSQSLTCLRVQLLSRYMLYFVVGCFKVRRWYS